MEARTHTAPYFMCQSGWLALVFPVTHSDPRKYLCMTAQVVGSLLAMSYLEKSLFLLLE